MFRSRLRRALLASSILALPAPSRAQAPGDSAAALLRAASSAGMLEGLRWPRFPYHRRMLDSLYAPDGWRPVWTAAGRPTRDARDAVALLRTAGERALHAEDYDAALLDRKLGELAAGAPASARDVAWFDMALSVGLLRHLSDVHVGRVNPRNVSVGINVQRKKLDLSRLVHDAVAAHRVASLVRDVEPKFAQYRSLLAAYARYRVLADSQSSVVQASRPTKRDPSLPDSGVAPAVRARQLELAIERIRWLPAFADGPFIVVNVPSFELYAFDRVGGDGAPTLIMNVVVGKAGAGRATPLFEDEMRYIIFRPYWVITPSITRNEILPAVRRDGGYLARNDMELYVGDGDTGPAVPTNAANLARVAGGTVGIRQRPGPRNALGPAKFIFPNDHNVYLHGTPATELFSRVRRDFSHGCIRLQDPPGLAMWVLRDSTQWSRSQVEDAMRGAASRRIDLARPLPVMIYYTTAVIRPGNIVAFYGDVYGHDAKLERALAKGYPFDP